MYNKFSSLAIKNAVIEMKLGDTSEMKKWQYDTHISERAVTNHASRITTTHVITTHVGRLQHDY